MEDSRRRATGNKRLHVNQRVSGAVGEYVDGPTKRRRRQRLYGYVISAIGEKKYLVKFDDGSEKECSSNILRVERSHASIPPDVPLPPQVPHEHRVEVSEVLEEVADQDEEEALGVSPDEEEIEAEAEEADMEGGNKNSDEPPNGMPGQLPTEQEEQPTIKDYATIKRQALEKVKSLAGQQVTVATRNNGSMTWTVIESHEPKGVILEVEDTSYGVKGFNASEFKKSEVICLLFLKLMFKNWKRKVSKLNAAVSASGAKCRPFTEKEFLIGLGILIGAAEFAKRGSDLFSVRDQVDDIDEDEQFVSLSVEPHFEKYMPFGRWKDFRRYFPEIFSDETKKDMDPWYRFSGAIDDFNEIRADVLCDSKWISVDETMCAWKPRKTATGGLPNISFIVRKPEPLGETICLISNLNIIYKTILFNQSDLLIFIEQAQNSKQQHAQLQVSCDESRYREEKKG